MKKLGLILILPFLIVNFLHAQTGAPLTNSTIIKMVKANLSDDLIIGEIDGAEVNFNLSTDSVNYLSGQHVSAEVLQAMKDASGTQTPVVTPPPVIPVPIETKILPAENNSVQNNPVRSNTETKEIPVQQKAVLVNDEPKQAAPSEEKNNTESSNNYLIEKSTTTVNSMSYVNPLNDLIQFYDNQFTSLMKRIQKWDKHVRESLENENQLMKTMGQIRQNLLDKKNANPNRFNSEITNLKAALSSYRTEHTLLKEKIRTYGKNLTEELLTLNKSTESSIETAFGEATKKVEKTDPDPSINNTDALITIPRQTFKGNLNIHVAPLITIPACFENEILLIRDTIALWTEKAQVIIRKDSILKIQLDPLTQKLAAYLQSPKENQKLNKLDIDALKKQCASITKDRKNLAKQMEKDSEQLSDNLNKLKEDVIAAIKERFMDAIENIDQTYQDKF